MGKRPVPARGLCRFPLIHLLLIAIAGVTAYAGVLDAPFVFDDRTSIVENPLIRDLTHFFPGNDGYRHLPRRFLGYLTFALNYRLGGLHVAGYHLVNLSIHIASSLSVYWLCLVTFRTPGAERSRLAPDASCIALFAGLFFVLHPVQTQAVTYITQRFASLAGLLYLLAMIMWSYSLRSSEDGSSRIIRRTCAGGAVLAAMAAMVTKESAVTLPLAAFLYGRLFFPASRRTMPIRLFPLLMAVLIPFLLWLSALAPGRSLDALLNEARGGIDISRWDYFITQPRVVLTYLRLVFLPIGQNVDYDYPVYHSALSLPVLCGVLVIVGLVMVAVRLTRSASAGADPGLRIIVFGIGWFFVTLLVESSLIPLDDVIAEHRLYLPMAGVALSVAASAGYTAGGRSVRVAALSVLLFLIMGTATWSRNHLWTSPLLLWMDSVRKSPEKARPHYNLGTCLNDAGAPEAALAPLKRAVTLQPDFADAWHNLAAAHASLGAFPEAIAAYRRALILQPQLWQAHNGLGVVLMKIGKVDEAIASYREAVRLAPDYADGRNNLGAAYGIKGEADEAVSELEEAVRLDPGNQGFIQNLYKAREMVTRSGKWGKDSPAK